MALAFEKDPSAVLDFAFDWSAWLGADTISSYTVTISPAGDLAVVSSSQALGVVTTWLRAGEAGTTYLVTCQIVTGGGRTDERSMTILCRER